MNTARLLIATSAVALVVGSATAQEKDKKPAPAAAAAAQPAAQPPMPKPGPEHVLLKQDEGVWDASVEMYMAPNAPPSVSAGTETNKVTAGGLWLVTDFKSEMMGQPFEGHGVTGWDPAKKKYVGTWVDSMTTSVSVMESSYDAGSKKMTGWMEAPDETGKITKSKMVTEWKDADTRVFTMYNVKDGKETPGLKITYKRRK